MNRRAKMITKKKVRMLILVVPQQRILLNTFINVNQSKLSALGQSNNILVHFSSNSYLIHFF
jgi:hypothetical protein